MREHVQRMETINLWTAASQKAAAIDNDTSQFRKNSELLDHAKRQYPEKERAIYRAVSLLRQSDRHLYDKVRRDPTWFMNEGLIQDCSDQGGCCSRQCGCCAKRHLYGAEKGAGHCTPECWCCISDRGFVFSEETKKEIRDDMMLRLGVDGSYRSASPYLLNMATWNFLPPKAKKAR
ncbi:uncharacterized protein N7506_007231 [Penicillium brevicompactum]|uniref:uncharacterized protein n=1 Tax=Penicillium brevicompactum TaxID=5074 RepID=UPI002542568A|nr:uncharacterized protein N7506_007231 [Penicillium brevicompactum]KAJ5333448.1 hypothetical protein N7506_007231 [Penicillium brevicompactum]